MYICRDCDYVFEKPARWKESIGEYWGTVVYESMVGCPRCLGEFDDADQCVGCGEYLVVGTLEDGLCEECIAYYKEHPEDFE